VLQELNAQCEQHTSVDSLTSLIWLTVGAFAIGTEGFMIAGLLPTLARDLNVGLPAAGHLVTAFSLAYAVGAPRVSPHPWKTLGLHTRCHPSGRKSLHHYGHDGSFLPSKPRQTRGDAVATRGLPYSLLGVSSGPLSQEQQLKRSVAELLDGTKPWQGERRYVNNLAPDEAADAAAIYGRERYERLASIKKKYDPANMFRLNHNVIPAGQASSLRSRTRMRR